MAPEMGGASLALACDEAIFEISAVLLLLLLLLPVLLVALWVVALLLWGLE